MTIIINLDVYIPISLTMMGTLCMTIVLYKKSKKIGPRYTTNESTSS